MGSEPECILDILEELDAENFSRFRTYLTTKDMVQGFSHIKIWKLEEATRDDMMRKMLDEYGRRGAVEITLIILEKMKLKHLAKELRKLIDAKASSDTEEGSAEASRDLTDGAKGPGLSTNADEQQRAIRRLLQTFFKSKFTKLSEGTSEEGHQGHRGLLNDIFTEIHIIEGCTGSVYNTHEVRQVEDLCPRADETPVQLSEFFKDKFGSKILTVGIAGVGKTVFVHKFILDWAEGKFSQNVDFLLFFPFQELNIIKDELYTLWELILYFHPKLHDSEANEMFNDNCRVAFIFDGLDESRIPLNFTDKKVSSVTEKTTIDKLIANLIKGELVPSAVIWITSRPAAAGQIPCGYFDHVTEICGFTDDQKERYFKKRIPAEEDFNRIYGHIKLSRSLHILCHIPVFCRIAASVLLQMLKEGKELEKASTLTEMYTHFFILSFRQMKDKYKMQHKEGDMIKLEQNIRKLAKLAFDQLEKKTLIFDESDLKVYDINTKDDLEFTWIVKSHNNVFSFVHLTFQEFLAALHVFLEFRDGRNPLPKGVKDKIKSVFKPKLFDLYKTAVKKTLQSENGHLDLFLRFLLGLSLESNQNLLKTLWPQLQNEQRVMIADYIKEKIQGAKSADRCINLFHCLSELKDNSLIDTVQKYLKSGDLSAQSLSMAHWSALVFVLLMSEEIQQMFELKKYRASDEGLKMMVAVVKHTREALLDHCHLSTESCKVLSSVLSSKYLPLTKMDLSNNHLQDSGVKLLSDGLENPHCKLEVLWLRCCSLTSESCEALASILSSRTSVLKNIDLSYNELQDSGVKQLCTGLEKPLCKLEILNLSHCVVTEEGCSALASALKNNSHLKELDLTYNHPGDSGVKLLTARKGDQLDTIRMDHGDELWIEPGPRKYACELTLDPNTVHKSISLSENNHRLESAREEQLYPEHEERFKGPLDVQVLCRESLTGRCYWEVKWKEWASIAVAYKRIQRDGKNCGFDRNNMSWCLICSKHGYYVCHNKETTEILTSTSATVGVYLDWPAGTLSFYGVSEERKLNLIHKIETRFTEPLYAGFSVYYNSNFSDSSISLLCLSEMHSS